MAFTKNDAYFESNGELKKISFRNDPRHEVDRYCYDLKNYLSANGLGRLPIWKSVVFLKKDMAIILSDKIGVYVISGFEQLDKYIAGLPVDTRFTPQLCAKINEVLKK
jgi:hypothetical protein